MSEIVGRDDELRALRGCLANAEEGPQALVLEGEAGIGKSTLWQEGVEQARGAGLCVLVSRPAEAAADTLVRVLTRSVDVAVPSPDKFAGDLLHPIAERLEAIGRRDRADEVRWILNFYGVCGCDACVETRVRAVAFPRTSRRAAALDSRRSVRRLRGSAAVAAGISSRSSRTLATRRRT
jgi:AAA ATPase domain